MCLSCKWNIAGYISENNECTNLVKTRMFGVEDKRNGLFHFQSYISVPFRHPTNLHKTTSARFSFIFPFFFQLRRVGTVSFMTFLWLKPNGTSPRLAPQLHAFNSIQSKCPVPLLAVTATKAICHNRDKRNVYDPWGNCPCCFYRVKGTVRSFGEEISIYWLSLFSWLKKTDLKEQNEFKLFYFV